MKTAQTLLEELPIEDLEEAESYDLSNLNKAQKDKAVISDLIRVAVTGSIFYVATLIAFIPPLERESEWFWFAASLLGFVGLICSVAGLVQRVSVE